MLEIPVRHPMVTSSLACVGTFPGLAEIGRRMPTKKNPSPVMFVPAFDRVPATVRIHVRPIRSLPVLPNGMQAVRDLETGRVRVVYPARRPDDQI